LITDKGDIMNIDREHGDDSEYLYVIYLAVADDGTGIDFTTGKPLKTYDEWLNS